MPSSVIWLWLTFVATAGTLSPRGLTFFRTCLHRDALSTAKCRSALRDELSSKSGSERACPCHFRRNFLPGQHMPRASFSDAFVARFHTRFSQGFVDDQPALPGSSLPLQRGTVVGTAHYGHVCSCVHSCVP
jgi:hypothetical protein